MPVVYVEMWKGRSLEQKKDLAMAITDSMVRIIGVTPQSVQVIFEEIDKENWAIAGRITSEKT